MSCSCGSNVRFRSIIHLLSEHLFGASLPLSAWPSRPDVRGLGLSDAGLYAEPLAQVVNYSNTFFHAEPRLDILSPPGEHLGQFDFIIASDVFEHVNPPVSKAFANLRSLLKSRGIVVFSVPFSLDPDTVEHFPNLHRFEVVLEGERYVLHNTREDGSTERFDNLVFHGGPGSTLEMRLFSRAALLREFASAGFASVEVRAEPCFEHGIYWRHPWSVTMLARNSA